MKRGRSSIPIKFVTITCLVAVVVGVGTRRLGGGQAIGTTTKTAAGDLTALREDFVETLRRANDALRN